MFIITPRCYNSISLTVKLIFDPEKNLNETEFPLTSTFKTIQKKVRLCFNVMIATEGPVKDLKHKKPVS